MPMKDRLDQVLQQTAIRRAQLPPAEVRRALRMGAGLTQADVAAVLGVDRATVARYELAQREPRGNLRALYMAVLEELRHAS